MERPGNHCACADMVRRKEMSVGKVFLVGAGPGDGKLMTIRGKEVLEKAEVVVYDSLLGPSVLAMIPDEAEAVYAGKRAGNHSMPQEQINALLLEKALEGKKVVRLKGGDPFLFGRGGEELELLAEQGIPFEVVPGISSSFAVPAYNGIPVTHRSYTSSVHIITGHRKNGSLDGIDFEALTKTGGTLVFLMGLAALPEICERLMTAGMPGDRAAAVLERGTQAGQRRVISTLAELPEKVIEAGILPPAIIVVGEVCRLSEDFSWYEKRPLAGYRILLTRPEGRSSKMEDALSALGAEVVASPGVRTVPVEDNGSLKAAIRNLEDYRWLLFTSPYGVRIFMEQMAADEVDVRKLAGVRLAALGKGTAAELKKYGLFADLIPPVYDVETLARCVRDQTEPEDRILVPRARLGNPVLGEILSDRRLEEIPVYETEYRRRSALSETALFEKGEVSCVVFTSSSSVKAFCARNGELDLSLVPAVCIGPQTAKTASESGMRTMVAEKAEMDELVRLVVRLAEEGEIPPVK